jgi:hypothetical protein
LFLLAGGMEADMPCTPVGDGCLIVDLCGKPVSSPLAGGIAPPLGVENVVAGGESACAKGPSLVSSNSDPVAGVLPPVDVSVAQGTPKGCECSWPTVLSGPLGRC